MATAKKDRILVCCTGSVASIKIPVIVEELLKHEVEVKVVATQRALHFFSREDLPVEVLTDEDEWKDNGKVCRAQQLGLYLQAQGRHRLLKQWSKRGDPVLHIELRRWADVMLIAPLDANTMAKLTHGICDNLLTCIVRAWDMKCPLLFAPAMNTYMWNHPLTGQQVAALKLVGYTEIPVTEKTLMCGDTGSGAMAEVSAIIEATLEACKGTQKINSKS